MAKTIIGTPSTSKYVDVLGSKIHYLEAGEGDPILFLHGIPTSCYVWRNVIPSLSGLGRCIAPDLIGLGQSDKPDIAYTIADHIKYIEKFIEALNLQKVIIVMHGWGSVIGFHYAMENENNCKGLVFYEAFLHSLNEEFSLPYHEQLAALQELESIEDNASFIDKMILQNVMRQLTNEELNQYRQPFLTVGAEKPILQYIKELPNGNGQSEADQLIDDYTHKLTESHLPKLMLYSVPGFITTIATAVWVKENLSNLEMAEIGEELHLGQESYPELIGDTISVWLQAIEQHA